MGDRTLLGPADVSDDVLASMVGESLGVDGAGSVDLLTCDVEVAEYDLDALTTAGRYWVRGTGRHAGGICDYAFFVKVVQSWTRSPQFAFIPEHLREMAAAGLPWRNEPLVYRSDLGQRLPAGLSIPRAYGVLDIDAESAGLWLQPVDVDPARWQVDTYARAAYLLGRLAASPKVRPVSGLGSTGVVRGYAHGRVQHQVLPALRNEDLWRHPVVAEAFDPGLRARICGAADALPGRLDELDGAPTGTAHGDACPRNLLVARGAPGAFVLIDFGFWCRAPLGFDLTQLLIGEIQLGERPAAELPGLEEACLAAYVQGLRDEGCDVPLPSVRRAHALLLLLFWGLSAVPLEVLHGMPASTHVARERAQAVTFVLDLVDSTG